MQQYFAVQAFKALFMILVPALAWSHSGGLDSTGGHSDRRSGLYHCHRAACDEGGPLVAASAQSPASDYKRADWPHWQDTDGDCMNTRHEMLAAQATGPLTLSADGCSVARGQWLDPFSGGLYTQASDLDVDHIVPLAWSHRHGGALWSKHQKTIFANDPENLLVVDDGLNQAKGAQGPNDWLPPNTAYHCTYLASWERLLSKYRLSMSDREASLFRRQQQDCPA